MTTAALIVAAGRGRRAGGNTPKQWRKLNGRRIIDWTLDTFLALDEIDHIVVVLHPDDRALLDGDGRIVLVDGGETRDASVRNGLLALENIGGQSIGSQNLGVQKVLIHDVARPCLSPSTILDVLDAITPTRGAAPAIAVTDALWHGENGHVCAPHDRAGLFRAQTPQGFDFPKILAAHLAHKGAASDDVEIARRAGIEVKIIAGDENNIKITTPQDFDRAARILSQRTGENMDIRVGNGFDVHAFCEGDHVILCGVRIPHKCALLGHSDADVAMHAVTDALYGALAEGDIGRHFPPSEARWKGASSDIFLRHAVGLAKSRGFKIGNVDCTLICEHPKIGPHSDAMRAMMADIMTMDIDRISIKATTSERLGFTGREEGIATMATITLVKT